MVFFIVSNQNFRASVDFPMFGKMFCLHNSSFLTTTNSVRPFNLKTFCEKHLVWASLAAEGWLHPETLSQKSSLCVFKSSKASFHKGGGFFQSTAVRKYENEGLRVRSAVHLIDGLVTSLFLLVAVLLWWWFYCEARYLFAWVWVRILHWVSREQFFQYDGQEEALLLPFE